MSAADGLRRSILSPEKERRGRTVASQWNNASESYKAAPNYHIICKEDESSPYNEMLIYIQEAGF